MNPFPFSESEWSRVAAATLAATNATLADDEVLSASHFVELQSVLTELRRVYGDHPVLLETEADFAAEGAERIALYEAVKRLPSSAACQRYSACDGTSGRAP
jgi:hypothetical protein